MKKILVLGSCRVLVTMNASTQFECINTWSAIGQRHLNPKYIIGRGWSILEHLDTLKKLTQNIDFFNDRTKFISHKYSIDDNQFYQNLNCIKNNMDSIDILIIEVSSACS